MSTSHIVNYLHFSRRSKLLLLAFFSFSGILLGVITSHNIDPFLFPLMHSVLSDSVSIVDLIVVACFPFLITAIIVLLSNPCLFLLHSFVKSFSYAFVRSFTCISFGDAGWIVGAMMVFSDTLVMCVLHWFWIRHLHFIQKSAKRDLLICFVLSLVACFIDYFWVSGIFKPY